MRKNNNVVLLSLELHFLLYLFIFCNLIAFYSFTHILFQHEHGTVMSGVTFCLHYNNVDIDNGPLDVSNTEWHGTSYGIGLGELE